VTHHTMTAISKTSHYFLIYNCDYISTNVALNSPLGINRRSKLNVPSNLSDFTTFVEM